MTRLHPDDIDAIADRVAEKLRGAAVMPVSTSAPGERDLAALAKAAVTGKKLKAAAKDRQQAA